MATDEMLGGLLDRLSLSPLGQGAVAPLRLRALDVRKVKASPAKGVLVFPAKLDPIDSLGENKRHVFPVCHVCLCSLYLLCFYAS